MSKNNGATAVANKKVSIELPAPELTTFDLVLTGTTPLITDSFSEPRKAAFQRTQDGSAKQKPGPRDPEAEFHESMYQTPDGDYGVPKLAFRKAFQAGAMRMTEVKGTVVLAAFQINTSDEVIKLDAPAPTMRTDHVVRVGRGNLVYRAEFWPWKVTLPIRLDHEVVSLEQFAHIVYKAGMGVGIGNWRPEKRGDFGCWTIEAIENVTVTTKGN